MTSFVQRTIGLASAATGMALVMFAFMARQYLEQTMTRHMLVQIPMLFAVGFFWGCAFLDAASHEAKRRLAAWNENGLPGLFAFLLVSAYWMIPKALDDAIMSPQVELAKFFSITLAGFLLPLSLAHANTIIQLFFCGNFASMTAFAGMLYQEAPVRLCNAYLQDDQQYAGIGLVAMAITVPVFWYMIHRQDR